MSSITYNPNHTNPFKSLPLIGLIFIAALFAGLVIKSHALKHTLGSTLLNCSEENLGLKLLNPDTGRETFICEFREGEFGEVTKEGDEVMHALANSKGRPGFNELSAVIYRAVIHGYTVVQFVRPDLVDRIAEILSNPPK